jgi:acetylornithine/N-succinyldiaminopimelate aminotransferase
MEGSDLGRENELLAAADRHLLGNYRPARMILERGRGCELFDTEGRRYLDFCAGVAVCCLGHAHPELVAAISEQAGRLMQTSNYFYNSENVHLAEELCSATGFDRAFFCNSGAEANEAMLKLARQYFFQQGDAQRVRIICFERAFHGRTMGALSLTGNPNYLRGMGQPLAGIEHVPYGDLDAVRAKMGADVAAVFAEPVQGEGGVFPAPDGFLAGLRALCDEHGALLMLDEVQVGMGRTGTMLGADHWGVKADAIALAKGLGGGFPIGAMLLREKLAGGLPPGTHGSTFGGNPLAAAAARTVLRVLREQGLIDKATQRGERLGAGLARVAAAHPKSCTGARGLGLLRAITLVDGLAARDFLQPARDRGLLLTAAGPSALRFTPPLVVSDAEIDEALTLVDATLSAVEGG